MFGRPRVATAGHDLGGQRGGHLAPAGYCAPLGGGCRALTLRTDSPRREDVRSPNVFDLEDPDAYCQRGLVEPTARLALALAVLLSLRLKE